MAARDLSPSATRRAKLGDQVTSVQSQVDTARSQLLQARLAQSTYQSEFAQLARLGEAVPGDDDVPSLIYQLQHAANGASVDFRGLSDLDQRVSGPRRSRRPRLTARRQRRFRPT